MFLGEYKHTLDAKGRLFIPTKLREGLGEEFVISKGFDNCIFVFPTAEWERFTEKLEQLPIASHRHIRRAFYAGANECTLDAQGRIVINQSYREFAGIEKDVVIVGNRSRLEIWSQAAWDAEQSNIDMADVTKELTGLGF